MIMRGDTPRALTWPASLAVLGLAALLLPLLPAWGQDAATQKQVELRLIELRRARVVVADKEAAELAQAEAELVKKLADVKAARAKLEAARAKEAAKAKVVVKKGGLVVRIEISGTVKVEELKDIARKIEAAFPAGSRILVTTDRAAGRELHPRWPPGAPGIPAVPQPPGLPAVKFGMRVVSPHPATDKRIESLEKTLDKVLKELEALRKELKGRRPGVPGGPRGPGIGPRPGAGGPALPPAGGRGGPGVGPRPGGGLPPGADPARP